MGDAHEVFYSKLDQALSNRKDASSYLSSARQAEIMERIEALNNGEVKKKDHKDYRLIKTYQLCKILLAGKKKKQNCLVNPKTQLVYVSHENMFDIIQHVHLATSHGSRDRMYESAKHKYANVTKEILQLYADACVECRQRRINRARVQQMGPPPQVSNIVDMRGFVHLVDMPVDGDFRFLLVYQDVQTEFVVLRALRTKEKGEVADVLLDLFCIIGAPVVLQSNGDREFTTGLKAEISRKWSECVLLPAKDSPSDEDMNKTSEDLKSAVDAWMEESSSTAWSTRISSVQWEHNNNKHCDSSDGTPSVRLFHQKRAGLGQKIKNLRPEDLVGIRSEEDMERALNADTGDGTVPHARSHFERTLLEINKTKDYSSSLLTKQKFDQIIERLDALAAGGVKKEVKDYRLLKTYEVVETVEEGETVQVLLKPGTATRYIRSDEMYNAIQRIHLETDHGARDGMHERAKLEFVNVTKEILQLFVDQCEACQEKKKSKARKGLMGLGFDEASSSIDYRLHIEIMAMDQPDGDSRFVLKCQDMLSKFILLRSLVTDDEEEVADHLVDIFRMFGTPYVLQSSREAKYTKQIVKKIKEKCPECVLVHGKIQDLGDLLPWRSDRIRDLLSKWQDSNGALEWSRGLRVVQWQVNNEKSDTGITPFSVMFRGCSALGLKSAVLSLDEITGLQNEEDLVELAKTTSITIKGITPEKNESNDDEPIVKKKERKTSVGEPAAKKRKKGGRR